MKHMNQWTIAVAVVGAAMGAAGLVQLGHLRLTASDPGVGSGGKRPAENQRKSESLPAFRKAPKSTQSMSVGGDLLYPHFLSLDNALESGDDLQLKASLRDLKATLRSMAGKNFGIGITGMTLAAIVLKSPAEFSEVGPGRLGPAEKLDVDPDVARSARLIFGLAAPDERQSAWEDALQKPLTGKFLQECSLSEISSSDLGYLHLLHSQFGRVRLRFVQRLTSPAIAELKTYWLAFSYLSLKDYDRALELSAPLQSSDVKIIRELGSQIYAKSQYEIAIR